MHGWMGWIDVYECMGGRKNFALPGEGEGEGEGEAESEGEGEGQEVVSNLWAFEVAVIAHVVNGKNGHGAHKFLERCACFFRLEHRPGNDMKIQGLRG